MLVLIHYGEIGLKGKNRKHFEERLASNIRAALEPVAGGKARVRVLHKRILAEVSEEKGVEEALLKVFGIEWFAFAIECRPELESIWSVVESGLERFEGRKFAVVTRRGWKGFPMPSMEVSGEIGGRIAERTGAGVDLENPGIKVHINILEKQAYVHFGKIRGLGGLPAGSGGKVLCLMSGGIDSPVAAWSMMKRGCEVDFLHVHPFEKNSMVKGTKIEKLVRILDSYQQRKARLILVPYSGFYARAGRVERRYELVVFRKYLYMLAAKIASTLGYWGVVSGDSLGQVASQTIENIRAAQGALEVPVFRPLISRDKKEIVDIAVRIGTYGESIKEYRDCCSLVSVKNPATRADRKVVAEYFEEMGLAELVDKEAGEIAQSLHEEKRRGASRA